MISFRYVHKCDNAARRAGAVHFHKRRIAIKDKTQTAAPRIFLTLSADKSQRYRVFIKSKSGPHPSEWTHMVTAVVFVMVARIKIRRFERLSAMLNVASEKTGSLGNARTRRGTTPFVVFLFRLVSSVLCSPCTPRCTLGRKFGDELPQALATFTVLNFDPFRCRCVGSVVWCGSSYHDPAMSLYSTRK